MQPTQIPPVGKTHCWQATALLGSVAKPTAVAINATRIRSLILKCLTVIDTDYPPPVVVGSIVRLTGEKPCEVLRSETLVNQPCMRIVSGRRTLSAPDKYVNIFLHQLPIIFGRIVIREMSRSQW